jgi:hypothetical protein
LVSILSDDTRSDSGQAWPHVDQGVPSGGKPVWRNFVDLAGKLSRLAVLRVITFSLDLPLRPLGTPFASISCHVNRPDPGRHTGHGERTRIVPVVLSDRTRIMNGERDPTDDRRHPLTATKAPESGVNIATRLAYWALVILVALCLGLVIWFWAVMLWPSHLTKSHRNDLRMSEPFHARNDTRAQRPEIRRDRRRDQRDDVGTVFASSAE